MPSAGRFLIAVIASLLAPMALCGTAAAGEFGVQPGSFVTTLSTNQAGAHPDLETSFRLKVDSEGQPEGGTLKSYSFNLPPGLLGAVTAIPTCPIWRVLDYSNPCPLESAVGTATVSPVTGVFKTLIFNVPPTADEPAALAFNTLYPTRLDFEVLPGGGLRATASNLSEQGGSGVAAEITLWGIPADHNGPGPLTEMNERSYGGPSGGPRLPFMTNPTECSAEPPGLAISVASWQHPDVFAKAEFELEDVVGCDLLAFAPTLDLQPETRMAGVPAGYAADLSVPQSAEPSGLATSSFRDVRVQLPEGVSLSPSAADGLRSCTDEQFGLENTASPSCPSAATVGTAEVGTTLLERSLKGTVYLGEQLSDDPLSGRMFRLFLVAEGSGVTLKTPGSVLADPETGRLTAIFSSTPQLPFEHVNLRFNGGPRAPLVTPTCGTYATGSEIAPWSGEPAVRGTSGFAIDGGCARAGEFTPSMDAGVENPVAGRSSPFILSIKGDEGQQNIAGFQAELPAGEMARLRGVAICPGALASRASCPASSRIGSVAAGIGPGPDPLYLPRPGGAQGGVFLAGPHRGAPFSIVVEVPARAGPFDLGTVAVRAALDVDPQTAQVKIKSDPLPQFMRGVPITYRTFYLDLDRPGFAQNPTSCEPTRVAATATSVGGQTAVLKDRFQASGCGALGFRPRVTIDLNGGLARNAHPQIEVGVSAPPADAGIAAATFALPAGELLDTRHIAALCDRELAPSQCPAASRIGRMRVVSPLLATPFEGSIYLRTPNGRLPDLVADLSSGDLHLRLRGDTVARGGRLRVRFPSLPDVPLSKALFTVTGGSHGIFVNSQALCGRPLQMSAGFRSHNGKRLLLHPSVSLSGRC